MVRGKSKGPARKKGRVSKKKKEHMIKHTIQLLRNGGDYPPSHQRTCVIDPRVAGAGMLGARFKAPRHLGHTLPRVGNSVGTQASSKKKATTDSSAQSDPIRKADVQSTSSQANILPSRADAGVQFRSDVSHAGVQVRNEGPKYPA